MALYIYFAFKKIVRKEFHMIYFVNDMDFCIIIYTKILNIKICVGRCQELESCMQAHVGFRFRFGDLTFFK